MSQSHLRTTPLRPLLRQLMEEQQEVFLKFYQIEVDNGLVPSFSFPLSHDEMLSKPGQFLLRLFIYRLIEEVIEAEREQGMKRLDEVADVLTFAINLSIVTGLPSHEACPEYVLPPPTPYFMPNAWRIRALCHDLLQMLQNKSYRTAERTDGYNADSFYCTLGTLISVILRGLDFDEDQVIQAFYAKRQVNRTRIVSDRRVDRPGTEG